MQKDHICMLKILQFRSDFGGLWKHPNNPICTKKCLSLQTVGVGHYTENEDFSPELNVDWKVGVHATSNTISEKEINATAHLPGQGVMHVDCRWTPSAKIQDYFIISLEKVKRGWTLTTSQYTITPPPLPSHLTTSQHSHAMPFLIFLDSPLFSGNNKCLPI